LTGSFNLTLSDGAILTGSFNTANCTVNTGPLCSGAFTCGGLTCQ
jgi:hypothetical protein